MQTCLIILYMSRRLSAFVGGCALSSRPKSTSFSGACVWSLRNLPGSEQELLRLSQSLGRPERFGRQVAVRHTGFMEFVKRLTGNLCNPSDPRAASRPRQTVCLQHVLHEHCTLLFGEVVPLQDPVLPATLLSACAES